MTYVYVVLSVLMVLGGLSFLSYVLNRPKPKFNSNQIARVLRGPAENRRYMLIEHRRWVRPIGCVQKQWVYDGVIFLVSRGELIYSSGGSCFPEESLKHVPGIEYLDVTLTS